MREGRSGVRLKRNVRNEQTIYTIAVTGGQIMTIRSLYLRTEQLWVHTGIAELVRETGKVERVPFWECHFCHHGSYEDAASIHHDKGCIIPLADKEFDVLNAQFTAALRGEERV